MSILVPPASVAIVIVPWCSSMICLLTIVTPGMNQHPHVMVNVNSLYLFRDLAGWIEREWDYLLGTSMVMSSQIEKVADLLSRACDSSSDKLRTTIKAVPPLKPSISGLSS